jgi:hypothetical protein
MGQILFSKSQGVRSGLQGGCKTLPSSMIEMFFSFRPPDLFHHFNFFLSPGKFTLRGRPHRRTINCPKQSLVNDVDVCIATVQLFMSR